MAFVFLFYLKLIEKIGPYIQHFLWKYVFPDWLFINWYRYGIMDEKMYNYLQENEYMNIDLDAEYIEQRV